MASTSIIGGLTQEITLEDLLEFLGTRQRPLVVSTDDTEVRVAGEITSVGKKSRARTTVLDQASTGTTWQRAVGVNQNRRNLAIWVASTSASALSIALDDDGMIRDALTGSGHTMLSLNPGDYWECPDQYYVGPVHYLWATGSVVGTARVTEWVI